MAQKRSLYSIWIAGRSFLYPLQIAERSFLDSVQIAKRSFLYSFQKNIKKWCPKWAQTGPKGCLKMDPKSMKTPSGSRIKTNIKKWCPKWAQTGPQMGSQNGAEIVRNDVLGSPLRKGGSQVAPRPPPRSILDKLWDNFRTISDRFSNTTGVICGCVV